MMPRLSLLLGLLLASPVVLTAAPTSAAVKADPHAAAAQRLVDIVYPVEIQPVQYDNLEKSIRQQYVTSAEFADLEQAYPGIINALVTAIMPHLKLNAQAARTGQRADMKQFYMARLTTDELKALSDFWGSPLGMKFIASLNQNLSYKKSVGDAVSAAEEGGTTQDSVRSDLGSAGVAAAAALTAPERVQIMRFMASPAGRKQNALAPDKVALDTKWFNMPPAPDRRRALEDTVTATMLDYITKADAAKKAK